MGSLSFSLALSDYSIFRLLMFLLERSFLIMTSDASDFFAYKVNLV